MIKTCDRFEICSDFKQKMGTQTSGMLDDSKVTFTVGQSRSLKKTCSFPIIKVMIGEIEERVSSNCFSIIHWIQALNPSSSNFRMEEIVLFAETYGSDLQDLKNETMQERKEQCKGKKGRLLPL